MRTTRSVRSLRRQVRLWRRGGLTVGFVPTMGALHDGHLSLIRRCRRIADKTVVSIFVNPTQFAPGEDFDAYPRTWKADLRACRELGVDIVFAPTTATVYPDGFDTMVQVGDLGTNWEGAVRPGHFDGVATVVLKLFNMVTPDLAVFGQKDYQQVTIIRRLVRDFDLPLRIVTAPTVRESDGLALSSRNVYLDGPVRVDAAAIHRALAWAGTEIRRGAPAAAPLARRMKREIESTGRFKTDYIGFCDPDTLKAQKRLQRPLVILIAATCQTRGKAYKRRFIDNLLIR